MLDPLELPFVSFQQPCNFIQGQTSLYPFFSENVADHTKRRIVPFLHVLKVEAVLFESEMLIEDVDCGFPILLELFVFDPG